MIKAYSLHKNIPHKDKQGCYSRIIDYYESLELIQRAIKIELFNYILKNKLTGKELENAKSNKLIFKQRLTEVNEISFPIYFWKEVRIKTELNEN